MLAPDRTASLLPEHSLFTEENVLNQFDLDASFGPFLGISRLERWERANRLGLSPPLAVRNILQGPSPAHVSTPTQSSCSKGINRTHVELSAHEPSTLPIHQTALTEEEALKQFDLDIRFGPFLGINRLERWERADRLGLLPPLPVHTIILEKNAMYSFIQARSCSQDNSQLQDLFRHDGNEAMEPDATLLAEEDGLMQFDFDAGLGPFLGITRLERWERAKRLGLSPPLAVRELLMNCESIGVYCGESPLW